MPRMLSQIRRELKKNVPPEQTPEAEPAWIRTPRV
jgi:hypothetical protein